jgi:transcriptional regulator with XRE-family HTH domain
MQLARTREWREALGLTQKELAVEADVGEATVARIELGASVTPSTARKVAKALNVAVVDLLEHPPEPAKPREEPVPLVEAPEEAGLLAKAKDAARRDMRRESQAIQRARASEGPQSVSGYEEDRFRAELRLLDFEEVFEKVLWPAVQEAVEGDQLREEYAKLQEEAARLRDALEEAADHASREANR